MRLCATGGSVTRTPGQRDGALSWLLHDSSFSVHRSFYYSGTERTPYAVLDIIAKSLKEKKLQKKSNRSDLSLFLFDYSGYVF